jgi:26S proteasome regulatory subunit (ATPase 3-interacting protein)
MATLEDNLQAFMLKSCRPYSANDIQAFMKSYGDYGKTELQRAIDKLVGNGRLVEKVYGKQKVYSIQQSTLPVATPAEIEAMEKEIKRLENELKEREAVYSASQKELKILLSTLTTEDLKKEIDITAKQVEELKNQLKAFDTAKPLDPIECKKVRTNREKSIKEWKLLRRQCMEMINTIMESYPGRKKELLEEMGVETDEEAGVTMIN